MKAFNFTFFRNTLALAMFVLFMLPANSFAQSSGEKNKVYEFFLTQKINQDDAKKIDATMLTRKGILACSTDAATGKVIVKTIPMIDFWALQTVVNYAGYECNQENMVIREE